MNQTTIKEAFILNHGVGLHSGEKTTLYFYPAPPDHGIVFYRSDKDVKIPATYQYAKPSPLCTTIEHKNAKVQTIEHLLSVCNGIGLDNLLIELASEEVPILDGSGLEFYQKFKQVGIKVLGTPKKIIRILDTIKFEQGDILIYATPSEETSFTFSIDFNHKQVGSQEYTFTLNENNYVSEILQAKTFCLESDVEMLLEKGLIKGGSNKNAILLGKDGHFNNMELMTWLNEPNLHKILDEIGDFYLANNLRIVGNFFSHKSGHSSHLAFIRYMMEECQDKIEIVYET
ncbi:MAG: UDP-3-O-[3-hydroxymyristoyl] N-acetylglucosamine deacetylase [bacterium]|jgi:UDP-3-O-[3-hydroxymyristoyl] N-acetylglucosamine deacetylase